MKLYTARYTLRNGHQATLTVIASDTFSAAIQVLEHFDLRVLRLSVSRAAS